MVLSVVAIALTSCASVEEDNRIKVQDIDHWSSSNYHASLDRSSSQYVKSFTVVASYEAIEGYGPDPKQAVLAISAEIVASHGFCPNGYSIQPSPHIGTYKSVNWKILCNE